MALPAKENVEAGGRVRVPNFANRSAQANRRFSDVFASFLAAGGLKPFGGAIN
jgi:hypothetical protein